DDDELRLLRQLARRAGRLPTEDLAARAVDEVDAAAVLAREGPACEQVAPFAPVRGRPDDRHRRRREQRPQVAGHALEPAWLFGQVEQIPILPDNLFARSRGRE